MFLNELIPSACWVCFTQQVENYHQAKDLSSEQEPRSALKYVQVHIFASVGNFLELSYVP